MTPTVHVRVTAVHFNYPTPTTRGRWSLYDTTVSTQGDATRARHAFYKGRCVTVIFTDRHGTRLRGLAVVDAIPSKKSTVTDFAFSGTGPVSRVSS